MNSTVVCNVCKSAVALITAEANMANSTTAAISTAVTTLCRLIGGAIVAKECKFICSNIDQIVSWVDKGMSHTDACKKLHLC